MRKIFAGLMGLVTIAGSPAEAAQSAFDPPLRVKTFVAPAKGDDIEATVTCRYYPRFMVKVIDAHEKGAEQLSIIPLVKKALEPACWRANIPSEFVIDPAVWAGYFKGVKSDYVFFDADDGWNGGLAFAVFDARTGEKILEDSAAGELSAAHLDASRLTMRYRRVFAGDCSVPQVGASCWKKIALSAGLDPASDSGCERGYAAWLRELAQARCKAGRDRAADCIARELSVIARQQWNEDASVIVYPVEALIEGGKADIRPLGGPVACYPAD